MTERLFKSVTFTLTQKKAEDWNSNTFEKNLQYLRNKYNNQKLSEFDMTKFEFNNQEMQPYDYIDGWYLDI